MARASKVEACMLCEQMPCECNKPAPKPKKAAAPKPKPVVTVELPDEDLTPVAPAPKPNALAAMKAAAKPTQRAVPDSANAPRSASEASEASDDEKADFARAIRVLADMLHPTERARYHKILNEKPSLAERRDRWRSSRISRSHSPS